MFITKKKHLQLIESQKNNIKELQSEIEFLEDQVDELTEQLTDQIKISKDPKTALNIIIESGIEWYDYTELERARMIDYMNHAQGLLRNHVLKNEINFLVNNAAKKALEKSDNHQDVRDQRITAIALKALEQRLQEIYIPEQKQEGEVKDPYSGI